MSALYWKNNIVPTTLEAANAEQAAQLRGGKRRFLLKWLRKAATPMTWIASLVLLFGMVTFPRWMPEFHSVSPATEVKHIGFEVGTGKPVVYIAPSAGIVIEEVKNNASKR